MTTWINPNIDFFSWTVPETYYKEASDYHLKHKGILSGAQFWTHNGKIGSIGLKFNNGKSDLCSPIFGEKTKIDKVIRITEPVIKVNSIYNKNVFVSVQSNENCLFFLRLS